MTLNTHPLEKFGDQWVPDSVGVFEDTDSVSLTEALSSLKNLNESALKQSLKIDRASVVALRAFAKDNGFTYNDNIHHFRDMTSKPGPAWTSGTHDGLLLHAISGAMYGYGISMSALYKSNGSSATINDVQKYKVWKMGIVRVQLNKVFPQVLLDSNKNDRGIFSSVHGSFKDSQRVELEGGFSDSFDFYSPHKLHVNTLTILAPNFMQIIKDSSAVFDVEIIGSELILTTYDPLFTVGVMNTVDIALQEQLKYMQRLEQSWSYTPIRPPYDLLRKDALGGQKIKIGSKRISINAIVLPLLLLFFFGVIIYSIVSTVTVEIPKCETIKSKDSFEINC